MDISHFNVPELPTSLAAQGGLKKVKGGCGSHMLVTWTLENHTTNFGVVSSSPDTNLCSSMIRLLRHIHISQSASEGNHTPSFLQSSVSPAQNLTIMINWKTSATWRLASKWSRCGQVWQPCRPGLVELSDASKIRVVWNWTELRPREWTAFFLRFQAERCRRHTVSFRNEVAGKTRMNY